MFETLGFEQRLVSPNRGVSPLEPRSLKWPLADASVRSWLADAERMNVLATTARADDVDATGAYAIYFASDHVVVWDFPGSEGLRRLTRQIFEGGGVLTAVRHGYCALLNTGLSNGDLLVAGAARHELFRA